MAKWKMRLLRYLAITLHHTIVTLVLIDCLSLKHATRFSFRSTDLRTDVGL